MDIEEALLHHDRKKPVERFIVGEFCRLNVKDGNIGEALTSS
jgi:hypothetical protein